MQLPKIIKTITINNIQFDIVHSFKQLIGAEYIDGSKIVRENRYIVFDITLNGLIFNGHIVNPLDHLSLIYYNNSGCTQACKSKKHVIDRQDVCTDCIDILHKNDPLLDVQCVEYIKSFDDIEIIKQIIHIYQKKIVPLNEKIDKNNDIKNIQCDSFNIDPYGQYPEVQELPEQPEQSKLPNIQEASKVQDDPNIFQMDGYDLPGDQYNQQDQQDEQQNAKPELQSKIPRRPRKLKTIKN